MHRAQRQRRNAIRQLLYFQTQAEEYSAKVNNMWDMTLCNIFGCDYQRFETYNLEYFYDEVLRTLNPGMHWNALRWQKINWSEYEFQN